ncbi:hypothetical protein RYH80_19600 [Halobaculum sp. MBLA0147]|uniref:hypothetical protein n=1 Tax=Halobaculum sp. MBLA0147 TaxID=3079934 RepID=UPI0035237DD1
MTTTVSTDSDAVEIESATLLGDPGTSDVTVADDGSSATLRGALMNTSDDGSVTVAEVTISASEPGNATLDLSVSALGDEDGDPYDVAATLGSSVTVLDATDTVSLSVTANRSAVTVGDTVGFTVTREDTDVRVAATVTVGDQTFETGIDGVAEVEIREATTDAGAVTAVASKADTDDTQFAEDSVTIPVEESDESSDGGETTVRLSPTSGETAVGAETTFSVVVDRTTNGVGAIDATVSVDSEAQIDGVEVAGDPGTSNVTVSDDGERASIEAALMDTADDGEVTVANVTVTGVEPGDATVDVAVAALGDEAGNSYTVTATPAARLAVVEGGSDNGEDESDGSEDGTDGDDTDSGDDETNSVVDAGPTTTVVVTVDALPDGFEKASVVVETSRPTTVQTVSPALVSDGQTRIVEQANESRTTRLQFVDLAGAVEETSSSETLVTLTYTGALDEENVSLRVPSFQDDDGETLSPDLMTLSVSTGGVFPAPLPTVGSGAPPRDLDGDGLYEDVDGDGGTDFDDAIALAFVSPDTLNAEQVTALDFDGDGDLDIDDAIALAFE